MTSRVVNAPVLAYFSNARRTKLVADASSVGLGAVLVQFEDETDEKPAIVCFASKALSDTEKRYSQIEKEALAIVWSIKRFNLYLLGREFEVETDHRPLVQIFKPTSVPPGRIEKWILKLQQFKFTVNYRPGKTNIADPLSRLSKINSAETFEYNQDKEWICAMIESVAIDTNEIKRASDEDREIQLLRQTILAGDWSSSEVKETLKEYIPFRDEMTEADGYIVRLNRLLIPKTLRERMLELAHEGHPGKSEKGKGMECNLFLVLFYTCIHTKA